MLRRRPVTGVPGVECAPKGLVRTWGPNPELSYTGFMTAPPQQPLLEQPHRNHGLFSDHYLNETLPRRPDWQELVEEAKPVMERLKAIFEGYTPAPNEKEAQTEEDWVRPVLRALGHAGFAVQRWLKSPGGTKAPDYVFYGVKLPGMRTRARCSTTKF